MKSLLIFAVAGLLILESQSFVLAQNGQPRGQRGQGMQGRGQGPIGRGGQTPPLLRVFDLDGDNELSKEEIDAAATALRKLDGNKDGRLTAEELRPQGGAGGRGSQGQGGARGRQQGQRGQQQRGQRGQQAGPPGRGGPQGGGGQGRRGGDPAQADAQFAAQLMELDANKDSLLGSSELPEHMQGEAFKLADADQNGSLDKIELLALASQFRRNKLSPDGENSEMKNRPTGGAPNRGR